MNTKPAADEVLSEVPLPKWVANAFSFEIFLYIFKLYNLALVNKTTFGETQHTCRGCCFIKKSTTYTASIQNGRYANGKCWASRPAYFLS